MIHLTARSTTELASLCSVPPRNGVYKSETFIGRGVKLVRMGELFSRDVIDSTQTDFQLLDLTDSERDRFLLENDDLLFSRTSVKASGIGKCSIARIVGHDEVAFDSNMVRVRLSRTQCWPKYLFYYFLSPEGRDSVRSVASGAAVTALKGSDLARLQVPAPSVPTQRKIATILSAYDDLIENNLQRIKILEEMAQNLYREWFVRFRFLGHQHTRFVDSPLGRIPEAWEVVPLGKLTELRKDKFKEALHSECPLLDLAKMQQRTLSVGETGNPSELTTSRIVFEEDDILFGSIRPYLHKVALAPCRGVTNISVLVVRSAEKTLQSFLAVLLSSIDAIRWADQHSTGTKMPVIKWEVLRTMPVLLPSRAVLGSFEASVQPMLQTVKMASSRNQNLRRTRDLLLPRLISGEVDVSELDIAVPEEPMA